MKHGGAATAGMQCIDRRHRNSAEDTGTRSGHPTALYPVPVLWRGSLRRCCFGASFLSKNARPKLAPSHGLTHEGGSGSARGCSRAQTGAQVGARAQVLAPAAGAHSGHFSLRARALQKR
ncbi:hypothetical protein NDU88_000806 [Pleurodeles waltl]|uniref:Uncharacterized protein n=1 Tax=Pleurodeles waltl TaxID=8319 RepID=A0AAV7LWW6_PLEWA|nr:hypothetical protein NDU88_000806 [Pleurodeles waltl]